MLPSDRPTDDVIEDDAKCDRWFETYQREIARKLGTKTGNPRYNLSPRGSESSIPMFKGK